VRSLADESKVAPLRALGPLEVVEVDIYKPEQLRAALDGIDLFFHLAAVYAYVVPQGREEEEVIRPSVEGAANAIRAAADAKVPKFVLTSSIVTVPLTKPGAPSSTEADWTTDFRVPYMRAKTVAEQRAWELARERGVNLVTVLPGAICGVGFSRNTPSTDTIECIMRGYFRFGIPNLNFPYVDVRDVVAAHILAAEKECEGRFIVCNDHLPTLAELNQAMHGIDPSVPLPMMRMPNLMIGAAPLFDRVYHRLLGTPRIASPEFLATARGNIFNASNARAKRELGWTQSIPLEQSLRDTMETIKANRAKRAAHAAQPFAASRRA
jgi:dihydroflavonol-4-reductase